MNMEIEFPFATYNKRRPFHPRCLISSPDCRYVASLKITGVPNIEYAAAALANWLNESGRDSFGDICDLQVLRCPDGKRANQAERPERTIGFLTYEHNNSHAFA